MFDKVQVTVRFEKDDLERFNAFVKASGLSREEFIRTLCGIVTNLDVKPSEVAKLQKAYRR